jgi:predicted O-methyltransferase YrrM
VSLLYTAKQYLKYYFKAKNLHGVHSPFVYTFNEQVLNDKRDFYAFTQIEQLRKDYLKDTTVIDMEDLGAGSHKSGKTQKSISQIAKSAARTSYYGQLLFRIQQYYQYEQVLELGTSLGIGLSYLSKAYSAAKIVSIEGSKNISGIAQQHLAKLEIQNVDYRVGNFNDVLPTLISSGYKPNMVVIDGNHRYEATKKYFEMLWPILPDNALLVFDDIYWSEGMTRAWEEIKSHKDVFVTVDVFQFGLVFKRPEFTEQQQFMLR